MSEPWPESWPGPETESILIISVYESVSESVSDDGSNILHYFHTFLWKNKRAMGDMFRDFVGKIHFVL
jgi:hypothetical protein